MIPMKEKDEENDAKPKLFPIRLFKRSFSCELDTEISKKESSSKIQ